ncbi:Na+/H+ antiporter subunit E [Kineococcus gynurae]|uniref:Na+/H+ antiporter subunit E n=1 Tax=Kineococcus gynurae TaxID=452979 RepID=A0ABV5LSW3_9ACTN
MASTPDENGRPHAHEGHVDDGQVDEVRLRARLRPAIPWRERISIPVLVWLVLLWQMLWGDLSVANTLSGLALGLLVMIVLPLPRVTFGIRFRPLRILALLGHFVVDLVAASAQVAWLAVRPGRQPRNAVVRIPLHSESDLFVAMTAELTSLVPGSLIIEIGTPSANGQGSLYVHALGVDTPEGRQDVRRTVLTLERRIMRTFAEPAALAEYERRAAADGSAAVCDAPEQAGDRRKEVV